MWMRRGVCVAAVVLGGLTVPANALAADLWGRSDGTNLTKGKGVTGFTQYGPGQYEVTFNQDVSGCAYLATTSSQYTGDASYGSVFTAGGHASVNGVYVETKNPGGGLQDFAFNLVVQCPTAVNTIRFSVFDGDGTLVRGTPGTAITGSNGQYKSHYGRRMDTCVDIATIGAIDNTLVFSPGYVFANTGKPRSSVYIETKNPGGGLSPYPVHTASYCSSTSGKLLGAVVDQDGTFVRGHAGVTSARTGLGTYRLTFPRSVSGCAKVASIGAIDNTLVFNPGALDVYNGPTSSTVDVRVQNLLFFGGANLDRPFHLLVDC
jgi:hypothetical protein